MRITAEPEITVQILKNQVDGAEILRGDVSGVLELADSVSWERPFRIWTFRMDAEPVGEGLDEFMEKFETVLSVHESAGDYVSAWWVGLPEEGSKFVLKGVFCDRNPDTGPGFFKRAADGPRIAFWFGRIQNLLEQ